MTSHSDDHIDLVVDSTDFISWNGGLDFIRLILKAFDLSNLSQGHHIYLYVPPQSMQSRVGAFIYPLKVFLRNLLTRGIITIQRFPSPSRQSIINSLLQSAPSIRLLSTSKKVDRHASEKEYPRVVFPCLTLKQSVKCEARLGFIYDCQHLEMPELFSARERKARSADFAQILHSNNIVLVHSNTVKRHLIKYFSPFKASVVVLPLAPIPERWFFSINSCPPSKPLPSVKYFIVCNQFWKHKDHETAIRAFAEVVRNSPVKTELICTGNTYDHRFPRHLVYLKDLIKSLGICDYVRFTGFISKQDQIRLLMGSSGVIQPSLFEGTPGGGVAYEAMSVGADLFLSSTEVNLEIKSYPFSHYFSPTSHEQLAELLLLQLEKPARQIDTNEYMLHGKKHAISFAECIANAARQSLLISE